MNDIYVTLSGNVTDDPRQYQFRDGSRVTSMRMAVNRRVLDQQTNTWQTRDTTYYTVRCYRGLADNVQQSIRRGHPVVVYGKLRIKQFERDGEQRFWAEIEASSVGHDLKWGIATFEKPIRSYAAGAPSDDERHSMEDATREWELASRSGPSAPSGPSGFSGSSAASVADGDDDEAFDALVGARGAHDAAFQTGGTGEIGTGEISTGEISGEDGATGSATDGAADEMAGRVAGDVTGDVTGDVAGEVTEPERGLRDSGEAAWLPPALAA
ncbi:single-stranded DNA-binding protein [Microbispora hainanensis]|uniref:Single-stranded DNA-binding protein n=1 Tax=Microbispora hainanensis TaxID=568844 RepID=A0A544YZ94_9ACTN|nr:single-stranded DNA-binding protein [Microbispora hainanensis]TQS22089.1 single-stranded DNA-binding protein [Microbispora hainanensis]